MCVPLAVAVEIDTHPQTANVSIADSFTLSCAASAFPLPNISWWHNSTLVDESNPRITTYQSTGVRSVYSNITIVNATTSDGGRYVCRVGTPEGTNFSTTDSDTALILVQGKMCERMVLCLFCCFVDTRLAAKWFCLCFHGNKTC